MMPPMPPPGVVPVGGSTGPPGLRQIESLLMGTRTIPSRTGAPRPQPVETARAPDNRLLVAGMFAAVVLAGVLAHGSGALYGGFVWDDDVLLVNNELIKADDGLEKFWLTAKAPDYLPLTWTSLWLEWRLWEKNPRGYHVTNMLMHSVGAGLLLVLLRRLGAPGAFWAALIFAVHPVTVASVAWISERKNTLSMLFYLGSLIAFVDYARAGRRGRYALALGLFVAALLSKSSVIMLPVVLLLMVWWLRGRVTMRDLVSSAPFFGLSLAAGIATVWFQAHNVIVDSPMPEFSAGQKIAGAGWILWFYLYKALLPWRVTMIYARWHIDAGQVVSYLPTVAFVAVLAWAWLARRRIGRGVFFALAYFAVVLLPVLGFMRMFFQRFTLVSDHLQYLAMPAIVALAAGVVCSLVSRARAPSPVDASGRPAGPWWGRVNKPAVAAGLIVAAGLGFITGVQSLSYTNLETMWRDVMAKTPSCSLAYYNVAMAVSERGHRQEAMALFARAIELDPEYSEAYNNSGQIHGLAGEHPQALVFFRKALRANPGNTNALRNVVAAASFMPPATAREVIAEAVALIESPTQFNNLAVLLLDGPPEVRDPALALVLATRAVEIKRTASFVDTLAGAYAHSGDLERAIRTDEEALRMVDKDDMDTANLIRRNLSRYRVALAEQSGQAAPVPGALPGVPILPGQ